MENIVWIWLAAAVIFLIIELATPTLIFICFVAAAVVSGVYSFFAPESYYWQIGIFVAVSVVLLPLTRKFAKRISHDSPQLSNVDALLGTVALVTKAIDPDLGGQVRVEGEVWCAVAGEPIAENSKVKVVSVSGTKLLVEKLS
ncbi:MAG: NfeD family protein [bacterium]|nr:NfeD family protein [bacterium]